MSFLFTLLVSWPTLAQNFDLDRAHFLKEFDQNPAKASQLQPPKYDFQSHRAAPSLFQETSRQNKQFVALKDDSRKNLCRGAKPGQPCHRSLFFAGAETQSEVAYFLENEQVERNLERLEGLSLQAGQAEVQPWSGDYWATANGGISIRFNDVNFPKWKPFNEIWGYMGDRQSESWSLPGAMERLAPSEKYDLLLSDSNRTLTSSVLKESQQIWDRDGQIESWWGICHGWSPAAFMMKRPRKTVEIPVPGAVEKLKFHPDDLKALASHLWAKGSYPQRFIGGRCNDKNPAKDENGRILSADCFDVNPAIWHLALLHQMGLAKKSFVMDATYDYEVWNQPVASYHYSFFNPQSKEETSDFRQALIPLSDFSKDPYSHYRSPLARYVIGVAMVVTYVRETSPQAADEDSEVNDARRSVQYYYDLEVDEQGQIIGGEWYQEAHPDFLWRPASGALPLAWEEASLDEAWSETMDLPPSSWTKAAQEASSRSQPLYKVIDHLIEKAQ